MTIKGIWRDGGLPILEEALGQCVERLKIFIINEPIQDITKRMTYNIEEQNEKLNK